MRLSKGVLEWGGPSFMRPFADNMDVMSRFKEAALTRPVSFGNRKVHATRPIHRSSGQTGSVDLTNVDCRSPTVASLRRLITAVCNSKGLSAFWTTAANRPSWWPIEVPFQSPNCKSWFHCLCTGVSMGAANTMKFVCCSLSSLTSVAKLDGTEVTVGDVNRLQRGEDISGDAIDFCMRYIINHTAGHQGAFVFPYFVGQLLQPTSWLHTLQGDQAVQRMKEHLKALGNSLHLLRTGNLLFPVCILNHWVGIVVQREAKTLHILDSLPGFLGVDVYRRLHNFVIRYLYLVDQCAAVDGTQVEEQVLIMDVPEVKQQVNTHDCGIFLLANFEAFMNGVEFGNISTNGVTMRRMVLAVVHRCSMLSS